MRSILDLFQGIGTMFAQSPQIAIARIVLIFLGLMLGVLCDASTLLDATVVKLLILGMLSLLLSGIGGIIGGYVVYFFKKGKFDPTVGIAGVSCVPSTAKVAQKAAAKANPAAFILDYALGANICGVITTAILTGIYITLLS